MTQPPAEDLIETGFDLQRHLISQPAATFFVRAPGDAMAGAGIRAGDLLVVDRSQSAADGKIVVAIVDGELTVKRFRRYRDRIVLEADNPACAPLDLRAGGDAELWGVVTAVIHRFA